MNYDHSAGKKGKLRVLVAPLDWGLGHATRCIPVIYELLSQNIDVWLAGEKSQEILLKNEFPALPFLHLRGYRVKYGKSRRGSIGTIFSQVPRILLSIRRENQWLKKAIKEHRFDAIISDNRYGLYHSTTPSVIISHQLKIKSPLGTWSEWFLQKINYRFINRFTECWVPDTEKENGLAGELSHPAVMPGIPVRYLGLLSRLKKYDTGTQRGHLLISLSGPEPQRSILENKIIEEIAHYNGTATIARGLPGEPRLIPSTHDIKFHNHLPAGEMSREMQKAEYIIGRSGYTTVMDIMMLGKKSILVPTPGQTEQEYLSEYLMEKKFALCIEQPAFSLAEALQKAALFRYSNADQIQSSQLETTVNSFFIPLDKH